MLERAGFLNAMSEETGVRHAVLAVTLGLWVRHRALTSRAHVVTRSVLSALLWPVIWILFKIETQPRECAESTLILGLSAKAFKPE